MSSITTLMALNIRIKPGSTFVATAVRSLQLHFSEQLRFLSTVFDGPTSALLLSRFFALNIAVNLAVL